MASGSNQLRSSYYWSNFSTIPDIVTFVLDDFDTALTAADTFDENLRKVSLSDVTGYTALLALATRQVFGTLEITVSKSSDGTWNQSDVMIFSKNMGNIGAGSTGGTNVIDVLYAGFPAVLFFNPDIGRYLLQPILESQVNGGSLVGQTYAPQNLGSEFPNVPGNTSPHNLGIEESGNMIIMVLAHFQMTNDQSIIQTNYPLLKSWADYLVNQTFASDSGFQTTSTSDGITSFNQTNLALKGIIGVSAMSAISAAVNEKDDEMMYQVTAQQYMQIWLAGALSQDKTHLISSFGNQSSSGLIYNMYADKLLGTDLIPSNISQIQSKFYVSQINTIPFGIPLDSGNPSLSRLDWTMFSVASILDEGANNAPGVLQPAISVLTHYASSQTNNSPLAIIYNPENGVPYSGINSFAVGALFAPLVIGNKTSLGSTTSPSQGQNSHKLAVGPIVGGVLGGTIALLAVGIIFVVWRSRRAMGYKRDNVDRIMQERGLQDHDGLNPEFHNTLTPSEVLVSPFEMSTSSHMLSLPVVAARGKFAPLESTGNMSRSTFSSGSDLGTELAPTSTYSESPSGAVNPSGQPLEDHLKDLMHEILMVRNAVQNRTPESVGTREDAMSEAPPQYASGHAL